jgi:Protein of unknown function (DUF3025)
LNTLLGRVDWAQPWLHPYREIALGLHDEAAHAATVAALLNPVLARCSAITLAAGPLRFVPASEAPAGEAYEAFIARTACVPTRDNLHDLFNGIVWLRFPQIKQRLNELQAAQIGQHGIGPTRGAVRDALTLFDENAACLQAPERLAQALRERDWRALFVTHRDAWQAATLTVFGHALLEKLCTPRKPITAHVWLLPAGGDLPSQGLEALTPARLAGKPYHSMPVLGVPGWWPANEDRAWYDDASVFRPHGVPHPNPLPEGEGVHTKTSQPLSP